MRGAQIDGFINMPLEEALADSPVVVKAKEYPQFKFDESQILKNLIHSRDYLKKLVTDF